MFYIHGFGIKITQENRDELKEFYNQFEDKNKGFSCGYYMGYDTYKNRFMFAKNKISVKEIVTTVKDFKNKLKNFITS